MEKYQMEFARILAESEAIFFDRDLKLKDGRPTPYFVNMGLFRTGRLSFLLGSFLADMLVDRGLIDNIDVLIGPSYKGSTIASSTAQALWINHKIDKLFDYDRKEPKTHGEATSKKNMFVTNALFAKARVYILDDVATTMSTKYTLIELLKKESESGRLDLTLTGVGLAVDRQQTTAVYSDDGAVVENVKGNNTISEFTDKTGLRVDFLAGIKDIINYLFLEKIPVKIHGRMRIMDHEILNDFERYIEIYGV